MLTWGTGPNAVMICPVGGLVYPAVPFFGMSDAGRP